MKKKGDRFMSKKYIKPEIEIVDLESCYDILATSGDYINANFAGKTITSTDGEIKQDVELSRGTREQLYLAFRLGYALNYGSDGSKYRLPLIIDDAFVNFDRERLCAVLNALKEFAKTNQVLFFTCHRDYILSLVKEINAEINIVDI